MLAPMELPSSAVAMPRRIDEMACCSRPAALAMARSMRSRRQREVGVAGEIARQEFGGVDHHAGARRASPPPAPSCCRPPPCRRRARDRRRRPATRMAWISSGRAAMRMWLCTGPPFCARPAMSMTPAPLPSRCAAMPRMRADGDDAGAADAGDDDAVGLRRAPAAPARGRSAASIALRAPRSRLLRLARHAR